MKFVKEKGNHSQEQAIKSSAQRSILNDDVAMMETKKILAELDMTDLLQPMDLSVNKLASFPGPYPPEERPGTRACTCV